MNRVLFLVVLFGLAASACAGADSVPPPVEDGLCDTAPAKPAGLVVAGSGPTLPIARLFARAFEERHPGAKVVIPGSIGSAGAIAALKDGAIDVALISRPLRESERAQGVRVEPFARVAFGPVVKRDSPIGRLRKDELVAIFSGAQKLWPDGTPITPLVRERGDSGNLALASEFPELFAAIDDAFRSGLFSVCYSDAEMRDALLETPGAIGLFDAATIAIEELPLKMLSIGGGDAAAAGPLSRTYFAVAKDPFPSPDAAAFFEFLRSDTTRGLLSRHGVDAAAAPREE